MSASVVVIGAGVSGLSTAVCLAEAGMDVRVDTDRPSGVTTSAAAGAMWDPYLAEPSDLVERWGRETLSVLTELSGRADTGVRLVEGTQESRVPCDMPTWGSLVGARLCPPDDLRPGYVTGWRYRAPLVDMRRYLQYLERRLVRAGGSIRRHRYGTLDEALHEAPVVVNCSGAEARFLADDPSVKAVRGQLVVVENPGIRSFFCDDTPGAEELTYIYPHPDVLVLGGTSDPDNWELVPDETAAREIIRRCAAIEPSIAGARVVEQRVGLRPVRKPVRLTEERRGNTLLVHNYGHGGAGVTLSWGCAREIVERVRGATGHRAPTA
ncbi:MULTISPECIES: FAD-dependent oxidoreductase [Streptomyces]|uniref:D-amino-acid oxidase n=1 Tax=Streptomyces fuscus TaxID=3048495 RepID=A0ABT7IZE8_9ACTN|nr:MULTISPECIES: FAD-dependent oxidoreductase [Streptomyces]MCM1973156.1 FAD-binding oxidoreductase [Streptomyces sp. G1]MDL2077964.1 FAD-dependent oxidoreductase [Streptomyces fuscus]